MPRASKINAFRLWGKVRKGAILLTLFLSHKGGAPVGTILRHARLAVLLGTLGMLLYIIASPGGDSASADPAWPTPPPAPFLVYPKFESNISPVEVPSVAGAISSVIQPIALNYLPAIPP